MDPYNQYNDLSYQDQRELDTIHEHAQSEFEQAAADLADAEEAADRQEQE